LAPSSLPGLFADNENIITASVYERPVKERPRHETLETISAWLIGGARRNPSFTEMIDEFAWRLLAAGFPLLRLSLHAGTLHPQFLGVTYIWGRDIGNTQELMIRHEIAGVTPYEQNPVRRVREGGETLRCPLEGDETAFEFSFLSDLKMRGGTEFFALPIPSPFGFGSYMMAFLADRPGGFREQEIADLTTLSQRLSVIADMNSQRQIAKNVLRAYLGPQTGPRVLAGQIRRGSAEAISAVLWSSDLRGFTLLSDHAPGERVIEVLNQLFDLQAKAIEGHGGEILKFIGDGLLAIFPVSAAHEAATAAAAALAAARETLAALAQAFSDAEAPRRLVVALHYGEVLYGNIGSTNRLDFTVIGPAVNLVSRVEAIAKARDLPLIVTDDFVAAYGQRPPSLGLHRLAGLEQPHELFAPELEGAAADGKDPIPA
jgi:adenylate cyclase